MNTKTVTCPHCHGELDTPESLKGKEVQCPLCQKNFIVEFNSEETLENTQINKSSQVQGTGNSGLKIIEKQTNKNIGLNGRFFQISIVLLILLLLLGNCLLFFSMQQQLADNQNTKQQLNSLQDNINSAVELSEKKHKEIANLFDRNQRTLSKIEQGITTLTTPSAYEYKFLNFDRDQRYSFNSTLRTLAREGWEYVGVLTNNGMNSKEVLFRRKLHRR